MVRDSGGVSTLWHHYRDDLEAFTWSALVAIGIAIKDHKTYSKVSEHLFAMHWLAIAKKRKTFSKSIVSELQWLIDEGKKKSLNVRLKFRVEYLYATSSGDVTIQNGYFKFTYTVEVPRNNGWESLLLTPKKWQGFHESIRVRKGDLISADDTWLQKCSGVQGGIVKPLRARVYGDVEFVKLMFIKHNPSVEFVKHISNEFYYPSFPSDK